MAWAVYPTAIEPAIVVWRKSPHKLHAAKLPVSQFGVRIFVIEIGHGGVFRIGLEPVKFSAQFIAACVKLDGAVLLLGHPYAFDGGKGVAGAGLVCRAGWKKA